MAKVHVNPKTGEPGSCSADQGNCPYDDVSDHFESADEARKGFEREMEAREKYGELQRLSGELIGATLTLRSALDERMKHRASDPEWAEIKSRVAAAKASHEKVLARVSKEGLNARDLILGVDDAGNIFNKDQLYRVRPYVDEEYSRMAGVPIRAGSDLPMPGDAEISKDRKKWEAERAEMEALPAGSPERGAARAALVKRVVRDMPTKYALDALKRTGLSDSDQLQVLRGQAVHKAIDKQRKAGTQSSEENAVYAKRALKAGQEFIDSLK